MSRIGLKPIDVPAGVEVNIDSSNNVTVKGKNGTLSAALPSMMVIKQEGDVINVARPSEKKEHKSLHGLTRSLLANMVTGVSEGFKKELEIQGVGYRAAMQGKDLVLNLGYSHQIIMPQTDGITVEVPAPNKIVVSGADKQKVGQFAAEVRGYRPPEPYKGKGIRYVGEYVIRKEGKAGKAKA